MIRNLVSRAGLLASAVMIALAAPAAVQAQDNVTLRLSHFLPPAHPVHKAVEEWAKSIATASADAIKVQIYPAQQLGAAFDHYNMARDGIADIAAVNPGYQPGRFPIAGAIELPLILSNATGGSQAVDSWYRQYAAKDMSDTHLCMAIIHEPATLHSVSKPIVVPADVSGMRVRTGNAVLAQLVQTLGGSNIQGSTAEVRDILEKGVADAVTWPWGSLMLFGVDTTVTQHLDIPLSVSSLMFVVNKKKYEQLGADNKRVLDEHCTSDWAKKIATPWSEFELGGVTKLRAMTGHTVTTPTAEQMVQWKQAAEPLVESWGKAVKDAGGDPAAILASLRDAAAKFDAAAH